MCRELKISEIKIDSVPCWVQAIDKNALRVTRSSNTLGRCFVLFCFCFVLLLLVAFVCFVVACCFLFVLLCA